MRLHPRIHLIAGVLAMAATVLLSSPGVRVARADDTKQIERFLAQTATSTSPSSTCNTNPQDAKRVQEVSVQRAMDQMRARIAAMPEPAFDPERQEDIVVLNNRGFNYSGGEPFPAPNSNPDTP